MNTLVPPVPHRFDYLEVASSDLSATESLFQKLGFCTTQTRTSPVLDQKLMIQGRIRVLLSQGSEGTYQKDYVAKNGEGICSIGYHVDSAKKTVNFLKTKKSEVLDEFRTDEDDLMFLQSATVKSVRDLRVTFVTRSGAPHDVLSPFAPGFTVHLRNPTDAGVGLLTFSSVIDPDSKGLLRITLTSADAAKTAELLKKRGLQVTGEGCHQLPLFSENPSSQVLLHFRKS